MKRAHVRLRAASSESTTVEVQRWPLKITGGTKCLIQGCTAYSSL